MNDHFDSFSKYCEEHGFELDSSAEVQRQLKEAVQTREENLIRLAKEEQEVAV